MWVVWNFYHLLKVEIGGQLLSILSISEHERVVTEVMPLKFQLNALLVFRIDRSVKYELELRFHWAVYIFVVDLSVETVKREVVLRPVGIILSVAQALLTRLQVRLLAADQLYVN